VEFRPLANPSKNATGPFNPLIFNNITFIVGPLYLSKRRPYSRLVPWSSFPLMGCKIAKLKGYRLPLMPMPRKKKTDQSARFIEAAKKAEADETGKKFERAFKKIVPSKRTAKPRKAS
jgi:hypothetical protein